jgi:NAD(P)-dependent dehydrogenase (short-subunit alcohol dehydrogenase family)
MSNPFALTGRVAIVTGSGSGIGRATTLLLAGLGVRVFATDINPTTAEETAASAGGTVTALAHDVTSDADWDRVFATVKSEAGRLDILVNNAGIMIAGQFEASPIEHLRRQQKINVESVFMGMQGAIPLMKETVAAHGALPSIINISSVYGQVAGAAFAAYSASKGAVRMLTKAVANELAQTGIRVNSVHPGPIATNLGASWDPPRDAQGNLLTPEQALAQWTRLIPAGRIGVVDDIAPVIAFLCSDASRYMTASEVTIDGGYTAI